MIEHYRKTVLAAVVLALAFASIGQTAVNEDGDWQFWTQEMALFKITDRVTGSFDATYRFGDDMSDLWYQHYDAGVIFKVNDWLSIKPSYRLKMVDLDFPTGDKWRKIHNPSLNFIFSHKLGKSKLQNNCRFSYWKRDDNWSKISPFYYRNIFMMVGPWSFTKSKIKPYIKEDFFYNCNINRVDWNRLSAGLLVGKWEAITPKMYLMWQADKVTGDWKDNYIVGLDFKFKF